MWPERVRAEAGDALARQLECTLGRADARNSWKRRLWNLTNGFSKLTNFDNPRDRPQSGRRQMDLLGRFLSLKRHKLSLQFSFTMRELPKIAVFKGAHHGK